MFEAARERVGINREAAFIQEKPGGDVVVVYVEGPDLETAFKKIATSAEPFDRWFASMFENVTASLSRKASPPPEQILDFRS